MFDFAAAIGSPDRPVFAHPLVRECHTASHRERAPQPSIDDLSSAAAGFSLWPSGAKSAAMFAAVITSASTRLNISSIDPAVLLLNNFAS